MTLHRRPLGRGRLAAAASALVILAGSVLPWFRVSGVEGLPPIEGNAFAGPGVLVFFAALAALALVALPFAAGDRPVALDRWWAYAAVSAVAVVGLVARAAGIAAESGELEVMFPDRAPGIWLAAVGAIGLSLATVELFGRRLDR
jgi:hypothetical protein